MIKTKIVPNKSLNCLPCYEINLSFFKFLLTLIKTAIGGRQVTCSPAVIVAKNCKLWPEAVSSWSLPRRCGGCRNALLWPPNWFVSTRKEVWTSSRAGKWAPWSRAQSIKSLQTCGIAPDWHVLASFKLTELLLKRNSPTTRATGRDLCKRAKNVTRKLFLN